MRRVLSIVVAGIFVWLLWWLWSGQGALRTPSPADPPVAAPASLVMPADSGTVLNTAAADPRSDGISVAVVPTPWLTGRVCSALTGEPVAGATVELFDGLFAQIVTVTTQAGQDGVYEFHVRSEDALAGLLRVRARAPGFVGARGDCHMTAADPAQYRAETLRLQPGVRVAGRVVRAGGGAVAGAVVHLQEGFESLDDLDFPDNEDVLQVDAEGRFEGYAQADWVALITAGPEFGPAFVGPLRSDDPDIENLVITLERGAEIEGRVLNADGDGIVGARVRLRQSRRDPYRWLGGGSVLSQSDGGFRVGGLLPEVEATAWVSAPGYRATVGACTPGETLEVVLRPARALRVRLQDSHGGVIATSTAFLSSGGGIVATLTADGGVHRSDELLPELTSGELFIPGYRRTPCVWSPGLEEVDLGVQTMERLPTARVRIVDAGGAPVVGAMVSSQPLNQDSPWSFGASLVIDMYSPSPVSDANGEVILAGVLPVAEYRVVVRHDAHAEQRFTLAGKDSEAEQTYEFRLAPTASLAIQVVTPDAVSSSPRVDVLDENYFVLSARIVDATGYARFDNLPVDVVLRCSVRAEGYLVARTDVPPLSAGEMRAIQLSPTGRGVRLRCAVVDAGLQPIQRTQVRVSPVELDDASCDYRDNERWGFTSPSGGLVDFHSLAPGRYRIAASNRDFLESAVEARAGGAQAIRIVLDPAPRYRPRIIFDTGEPVVGARVTVEADGHTDTLTGTTGADGRVDLPLPDFEEPRLTVTWRKHRHIRGEDPEVLEGLPEEVVVPRGGDVWVWLVHADGAPFLANAMIQLTPQSDDGVARSIEYSMREFYNDGLGSVLAQGVGPGQVRITVSPEDYEDGVKTVFLYRGATEDVTVVLGDERPEVECVVTVTDNRGEPIAGARVYAESSLVTGPQHSDEHGVARVLLRRGTGYELRVRKHGYGGDSLWLTGGAVSATVELSPN